MPHRIRAADTDPRTFRLLRKLARFRHSLNAATVLNPGLPNIGQVRLRALTRVRLATAERTCEASGTPVICAPSPVFAGAKGTDR